MGGVDFQTLAFGKDARDAFKSAQEHARYEFGHGGYTGTVAEKSGFRTLDLTGGPKDPFKAIQMFWDALDYVNSKRWIQDQTELKEVQKRFHKQIPNKKYREWALSTASKNQWVDEKWSDAACVALTGRHNAEAKARAGLKRTHKNAFIFFGIASC